jgi:hypothetical protein
MLQQKKIRESLPGMFPVFSFFYPVATIGTDMREV